MEILVQHSFLQAQSKEFTFYIPPFPGWLNHAQPPRFMVKPALNPCFSLLKPSNTTTFAGEQGAQGAEVPRFLSGGCSACRTHQNVINCSIWGRVNQPFNGFYGKYWGWWLRIGWWVYQIRFNDFFFYLCFIVFLEVSMRGRAICMFLR